MRVWVLTVGEPLPVDGPNERLFRSGLLVEELARRGHETTFFSSAFDHMKKEFRAPSTQTVRVSEPAGYDLVLLRGTGYESNVSIQRMKDHRAVANEFAKVASTLPRPDVILCSIPIVELATEALKLGAPVALDCRDMWPDILADALPGPARWVGQLALRGLFAETKSAFQKATAVLGHTRPFVEWGLNYAGRSATDLDKDFPFGYSSKQSTPNEMAESDQFWDSMGIFPDPSLTRFAFFGTLGRQFRIDELVETLIRLPKQDLEGIQFVICGEGDSRNHWIEISKNLPEGTILFPGWVDRPKIQALMRRSSFGLAPYVREDMFAKSIPNKVVEYLSGGLPLAWGLDDGIVSDLVRERGIGFCWSSIESLIQNAQSSTPEVRAKWAAESERLFHERFLASAVYGAMADHLEVLARSGQA